MIPKLKLLSPRSEAVIQKEILTFLSLHGLFVFRVNTTGVFDPRRKVFRKLGGFSMRGVADILGILPNGQFLAIEVKTATGKQSPFQKNFQKQIEQNHGVYILARGIDDVRFLVNRNWSYVA